MAVLIANTSQILQERKYTSHICWFGRRTSATVSSKYFVVLQLLLGYSVVDWLYCSTNDINYQLQYELAISIGSFVLQFATMVERSCQIHTPNSFFLTFEILNIIFCCYTVFFWTAFWILSVEFLFLNAQKAGKGRHIELLVYILQTLSVTW